MSDKYPIKHKLKTIVFWLITFALGFACGYGFQQPETQREIFPYLLAVALFLQATGIINWASGCVRCIPTTATGEK